MIITKEWIEKISGDNGLSNGQKKLLSIWAAKTNNDGAIPDNVAKFLEGCKGYYGLSQYMLERLSNESFNSHMRGTLQSP